MFAMAGKKKTLPLKIQDDSYNCYIDESEYEKQIALSPTKVKGRE